MKQDILNVTHNWADGSANIAIEGLEAPVRILHLTDVHLRYIDERDMHQQDNIREETRTVGGPHQLGFYELMEQAPAMNLDLLVFTGDMMHWPTKANIERLKETADKTGVPFIFTSGNHDYLYPQLKTGFEKRQEMWPVLDPLTEGQPECFNADVGGIRFVGIDNSLYQVTPRQLAFAKEQLAEGMPTVFIMHIPISLSTLRPAAIDYWGAPILMGDLRWDQDSEDRKWTTQWNTPETLEFLHLMSFSPNLVAILSGHLHFNHADSINRNAVQYVTEAGWDGAHRLVEFAPLIREP
jgi:hypothetical protein